jgi:hypothetical protein
VNVLALKPYQQLSQELFLNFLICVPFIQKEKKSESIISTYLKYEILTIVLDKYSQMPNDSNP